jgi:para-nitrobenzyl esterase
MQQTSIATILLTAMAALSLNAAITGPVRVTGGQVSGVPGKDPSIVAFKGIPFAAPPVGALRWRAPKPVVAWQGIKKADQFGNSCIQNIVTERKPHTYEFMAHNAISEDCLYINVWTAARTPSERRPVYMSELLTYPHRNLSGSITGDSRRLRISCEGPYSENGSPLC